MHTRKFTVRFLTPAFLGDAEQNGRWRTPPFKHLLREWWRVAWAADHGYRGDVAAMRREEGLLFGHAWLEDDAAAGRRSLVRFRLSRWDQGSFQAKQWPPDQPVTHPEVSARNGARGTVGSSLYLGYGPLTHHREQRRTALKAKAAIQAEEEAVLSLAYAVPPQGMTAQGLPAGYESRLDRALGMASLYGTLGSRSRNGWGSLELVPASESLQPLRADPATRPWTDCLDRDWPHAVGVDDIGPLIWQTSPLDGWQPVMKALATLKIGLRTQFRFASGQNAPKPEERHWLSYPVTNHSVKDWGTQVRLPNQLRFKVRRDGDGKLRGVIFHVPHLPPQRFRPDRNTIEKVWDRAHAFLDQPAQALQRSPE
jgi:CRISPR-associated protein Cmr1